MFSTLDVNSSLLLLFGSDATRSGDLDVRGNGEKRWVREEMRFGLGTKKMEGAFGSKNKVIEVNDAAAAASPTITTTNSAVPHVASDSISDFPSSSTTTTTHSEEGEVFNYGTDTIIMANF
ncbi:hypothetical protein B0H14DRAFT_3453820 [Mycena olivaceomarginata]|nr:hypothetical protein B0H14DRAFT_3453820 [Mycena olivaceomarginata]